MASRLAAASSYQLANWQTWPALLGQPGSMERTIRPARFNAYQNAKIERMTDERSPSPVRRPLTLLAVYSFRIQGFS